MRKRPRFWKNRDVQNGKLSFIVAVTMMNAEKSVVAPVPGREHIQVLTDARDDRNAAFIHGHGDNEFIPGDIFYAARVALGPLLAVLKEYFQPLPDS